MYWVEEGQAITREAETLSIVIQQGRSLNSHFICLVLSLGGSKVMDEGVVALRILLKQVRTTCSLPSWFPCLPPSYSRILEIPRRSLKDLLVSHCPNGLQMTFVTIIPSGPHVSLSREVSLAPLSR